MDTKPVKIGSPLWEPSLEYMNGANVTRYMKWLKDKKGMAFESYDSLWEWSVTKIEDFWESLWDFFEIKASKPYMEVLPERKMPGANWFPGSELNYAEHVFRNMTQERPALRFKSELQPLTEISWNELYWRASSIASSLKRMGIKPGDRVVAFLPNIPETIIAFLACASIGATWSCCSPDFGSQIVLDRFKQIEPKVLFAIDGYRYGGKDFDRCPTVFDLQKELISLENTVLVPYLKKDSTPELFKPYLKWEELIESHEEMDFEQVPWNHPLWVVYSSGTSGLPKALVHGHGGALIELLKYLSLHVDLKPGSNYFWFCTTGWIMWNQVQGGLLLGATPILFDGNPGYPDMYQLWRLAEATEMTIFGTSPAFLDQCIRSKLEPGKTHNLSKLKTIGVTGSPLPPEAFKWVYDNVKADIWLASVSGGTDVASAFLGCSPILPVNAGESQCRCLGVKAESLDENGNPLLDSIGELVISEPMPSMPLFLWNDPENTRYHESYFDMFPGLWRHGDLIRITPTGSAEITGRSDSILKPMGVRIGSSEIYSAVEDLPEVEDSLVLGFEMSGGKYYMPLFIVLGEKVELTDDLKTKIKTKVRATFSPRHVPDEIFTVPQVPRTLNGKKIEVPIKKILMGIAPEKAVNLDSMGNPESIDFFVDLSRTENFSSIPQGFKR